MNEYSKEDIKNLNVRVESKYDIFADDDDELCFAIGKVEGAPDNPVLYYAGADHAVLVKNKLNMVVCDFIHPAVREVLAGAEYVVISEFENGEEVTEVGGYKADVIHDSDKFDEIKLLIGNRDIIMGLEQKRKEKVTREDAIMKEIDWTIHCITNEDDTNPAINSHTHGMEKYSHLDFQLVLPSSDMPYLLNTMGRRVQDGEQFQAGDMVKGLYDDCDIRLDLVTETDRQVLRLIVPDRQNRFPEDPLCEEMYSFQTQTMFEGAE